MVGLLRTNYAKMIESIKINDVSILLTLEVPTNLPRRKVVVVRQEAFTHLGVQGFSAR